MSYVLIADDDEYLADVLGRKLKAVGLEAKVVKDGAQAIELISQEKPKLLLLDLLMPRMDGFGVLSALKEKKITIPIIILSNIQDPDDQKKALSMGAKSYFNKSEMDIAEVVLSVIETLKAT